MPLPEDPSERDTALELLDQLHASYAKLIREINAYALTDKDRNAFHAGFYHGAMYGIRRLYAEAFGEEPD